MKVDASRHAIKIGDLLVSSSKQGMAMRSQPIRLGGRLIHQPGTIIGKALEPLASGQGEILALLSSASSDYQRTRAVLELTRLL